MSNEAAEKNGFQPAYPIAENDMGDSPVNLGLTKRESFAQTTQAALLSNAKSIQEITAQCSRVNKDEEFYRVTAEIAVEHADALLEALER